jgi:hypothetical protein
MSEIVRAVVDSVPNVPLYSTGDALTLLEELAAYAENRMSMMTPDDADALRWAILRIRGND